MYALIKDLCQPYFLLLVALGLMLLYSAVRCATARRAVLLGVVLWIVLVVGSIPAVSYRLGSTLEGAYPGLAEPPASVDAIVVLGGGFQVRNSLRPDETPSVGTLQRCFAAAKLSREVDARQVIVCGGATEPKQPGVTEAEVMRQALLLMGVDPDRIVLDVESQNTRQNAERAVALCQEAGLEKIAIVTQAWHMPRAVGCFDKLGVSVLPIPCGHRVEDVEPADRDCWLPTPGALDDSVRFLREWQGIVLYWARGWL